MHVRTPFRHLWSGWTDCAENWHFYLTSFQRNFLIFYLTLFIWLKTGLFIWPFFEIKKASGLFSMRLRFFTFCLVHVKSNYNYPWVCKNMRLRHHFDNRVVRYVRLVWKRTVPPSPIWCIFLRWSWWAHQNLYFLKNCHPLPHLC